MAERVSFAGPVADERLHELYAAADVVCQPSRYESHGIVLVEAMMFGKAIVTSLAGGIPEVVEDGGNALLAEPGDGASLANLRIAVESEELRRRLAARSRELFLERFEIGVVARAMSRLLEDAIRAHEARPADPSPTALLATALDARAAAAEADRDAWHTRAETAEAGLSQLTGSRSWRLTGPLRAAARAVRRPSG